ncbi:aldo/keto reductase [Gloeocapsopsis crepidinum LEGE 06123]|uniref:Aldo/keto reductase n=1 Tax=Gloeocapsopsis crepidinum LEGE 06123 TaxID=588587 RepID=A0ABR9USK1_9CHRO|nr:aldo/keto reductase [Gloeocapsopsis crepidinum]MBE9191268.1 aldo/keto reductase [Gloeocapsopsis crepidinum LEGE 06123]
MEKRRLGTTDIQITPILMGTWQAGQKQWVGIEDEESIKAIRAAVDAGITTIDTAEVYGNGHSEQVIAQALNDVPRDRIVYATKVFANHLKHDQVLEACDRSLKNLKIDYIDLYQIHWPSGSFNTEIVPIEETMGALNQLKQQGKIRAIGVSNFSRPQLEEAAQYGRIDSIQPPYSLFWRWVEKDVMPYCIEHNISILAYSPLAQGLLTGKFGRDHQFDPQDNRAKNKLFQGENYERAQQALEKLRPIADRHQASLASLAIAWLIAQPQSQAIVGARTAEQAVGNAKAATVQLSPEELAEIDAIGRIVTDHLDENPVMWNW